MQQVGPKLCFRENQHLWLQGIEIGPQGKAKIQRHEEYAIFPETLARQGLPCGRGGGDKNLPVRIFLLQIRDQLAHGQHLSHGNGMDPDRARSGALQPLRHMPKPLPQAGAILTEAHLK